MATMKYFSGTEEVFYPAPMDNKRFVQKLGSAVAKKYDSFSKWVGFSKDADSAARFNYVGAKPITRIIAFKSRPSLHKCDARCRHAKGGNCECECGGKYHGAGN